MPGFAGILVFIRAVTKLVLITSPVTKLPEF